MKKLMTKTIICSAAAAGLFLAAQAADAGMTGTCVTCHTMHNSQNGNNMTSGTATAQAFLLRAQNTCVGCHSGPTNNLLSSYKAPIVIHTSEPTYAVIGKASGSPNVLAGGSFYWVESGDFDTLGHNVSNLSTNTVDGTHGNTPPGDVNSFSGQLSCESCHIGGSHHYNQGSAGTTDGYVSGTGGTAGGNSYRFLSGGIAGGESADWEWVVASNDHNTYSADADPSDGGTRTIGAFCGKCHGAFHGTWSSGNGADAGTGSSPGSRWRRHPTNFKLTSAKYTTGFTGSEYDAYDTYDPQSPVGATATTMDWTNVVDTTNSVVCMSCHRAHGSPYDDMLRWSYQTGAGVSGSGGCFVCHTTK